ncbi:DUF262 domain-containing protein [Mesorhizobium sp. ES1-1]|uniref:GmrSD restriction endonuclease domain-containing protein n=1 Tax=Mesorhizobium sp. ES1-1 TaxID=2876629 RepID=UPI001CCF0BE0|nr:DUF262 domain-containing protein [Mesorhizobium sp. ES1-1]MBZ9675069.1 DUF262 domain-containing protein [Mesorhizobium sp. ES1-1]
MQATQVKHTIEELIDLRKNSMLAANPEYQRGAVWNRIHQKKLIDSIMRGYPLPVIYLHHIKKGVGNYARDDFEIIDGQQRINAIYEFCEGAFSLFHPVADESVARFPAFVKTQPCPWGGQTFDALSNDLKQLFLRTEIPIAMIETNQHNEVRDLFVRLQSGLPLNHQETRDAWPGNFTEFVLKLGGKPELPRYPGHPFFTNVLGMKPISDRGKTRQLAAQLTMLFLTRRENGADSFCDINAEATNAFYYDHLDFDSASPNAQRLHSILTRLDRMLVPGKHPKLRGHDAIHAVLLVDALLDDYPPIWEDRFPDALDKFLEGLARGKAANDAGISDEFWTQYGQWTRVSSDRGEHISRRHRFYVEKMFEYLQPLMPKDPTRLFGEVERTILFYSQGKRCAVCEGSVAWGDAEVHHVHEHSAGGPTTVENGALVHAACHPKGTGPTAAFAEKFAKKKVPAPAVEI